MIGTLILTHGGVAHELLAAVEQIAGKQPQFAAISLGWDEDCGAAEGRIAAALAELDSGDGVLILTDTYGGTPCNLALGFRKPDSVEVVSGVNLPMAMRLACNGNRRRAGLEETAHWLEGKARQAICVAGDLVDRTCGGGDDAPREREERETTGAGAGKR